MILAALILGALVVGAIAVFWKDITVNLSKVMNKIKEKFNRTVVGCTVKLKRIGDKFQNRQNHFSQDETGQWHEQTITYEQNRDEIPDEYKQGKYATMEDEFDISDDYELALKQSH